MSMAMRMQGGKEAAQEANSSANASAKHIEATKPSSSLQAILPFLPVIFIAVAILLGYQFLGKQ